MKTNADHFMWWFCDELNQKQRQDILKDMIEKGIAFSGKMVTFKLDNRGDPFTFNAVIIIGENRFVKKLQSGLEKRTLQTHPATWNDYKCVRVGVVCTVENEIVALVSTGKFIGIEIGSRHFDFTIDAR